jgi:hypothetical protein
MLHGFARLAFFAERTACTAFRLPNWEPGIGNPESGIGNRESGIGKLSGISQAFFSKVVD